MVPSRFASRDEIVDLCSTLSGVRGHVARVHPDGGPVRAVGGRADGRDVGRPRNGRSTGTCSASTPGTSTMPSRSSRPAPTRREHGGRVVALTVPMSFPVYLSFRSGFVLDAMPGWEDVMGLPLDEKLAFFDDDRRRWRSSTSVAQRDENPMRMLANWANLKIHDVVAPENEQYRGPHGRRDRRGRRAAARGTCSTSIARADELNTSFGTVPAPETDDDWKARIQVWRDRRALIGASDAGAHLDLLASFNYATEVLGKAVRQRRLLPLEEAVNLLTDMPAQLYGLKRAGPGRGGLEGRRRRARPRDHREPRRAHAHGPARRRRPPLRRGRRHRARARQRHRASSATGSSPRPAPAPLLRSGRDTSTPSLL